MTTINEISETLRQHVKVCDEVLDLVEAEHRSLHDAVPGSQFEPFQKRKVLLSKLADTVQQIKIGRQAWQQLSSAERAGASHLPGLMKQNQDLIMKIIVLDRENEQALLRRGLLPARQLPSVNRQRPHFVAELYRRSAI
jgi:flagellar biosynthesis/type III secretory pathway chaperone